MPIARDALAPKSNTGDVIAAEDALSEGVDKEAIRAIREASPEPTIAVPLGVLTELVATGTKVSRASAIVLTLIKRGASGQQLAAMEKTDLRGRELRIDGRAGARAANERFERGARTERRECNVDSPVQHTRFPRESTRSKLIDD